MRPRKSISPRVTRAQEIRAAELKAIREAHPKITRNAINNLLQLKRSSRILGLSERKLVRLKELRAQEKDIHLKGEISKAIYAEVQRNSLLSDRVKGIDQLLVDAGIGPKVRQRMQSAGAAQAKELSLRIPEFKSEGKPHEPGEPAEPKTNSKKIIFHLGRNNRKPMTATGLAEKLGVSVRDARKLIESMGETGELDVSFSGKGIVCRLPEKRGSDRRVGQRPLHSGYLGSGKAGFGK